MKKYSKKEHKQFAIWAAKCAERVLPYFETEFPEDKRPRKAIAVLRKWIRTGKFGMPVIRKASLDSHAAARSAKDNPAACFAARAAGQAVATAHVPQHAYGAAYYSLKIVASNPKSTRVNLIREIRWQTNRLARNLRSDWKKWLKRNLTKQLKLILEAR